MAKNNVLVVDDDRESRSSLVKVLRKQGFQVEEAENGEKAFHLIQSKHFSVVITDISMPNGNGIELLKNVKKFNCEVRVFLMSGYPEFYADNEGFELADAVYKKPLCVEDLVRAVEFQCRGLVAPPLAA